MFVTIMFAVIFSIISLTEVVTGFQWGYRVLNVIALSCWWIYYRNEPPDQVKMAETVDLDELES